MLFVFVVFLVVNDSCLRGENCFQEVMYEDSVYDKNFFGSKEIYFFLYKDFGVDDIIGIFYVGVYINREIFGQCEGFNKGSQFGMLRSSVWGFGFFDEIDIGGMEMFQDFGLFSINEVFFVNFWL